jgi:hypothetical protein
MPTLGTRPPAGPAPTPPHERIAAAFGKLAGISKDVHTDFNELAKPVAFIETAFHNLNLGIPCWTRVEERTINRDVTYQLNVGYAIVNGAWRLAIETWEGPEDPEDNDHHVWPFNEAPQGLRLKCVDKVADLAEALVAAAEQTRKRMEKKIATAQELAKALEPLAVKK